jgi:non-ribosomal peptide synthetase component F
MIEWILGVLKSGAAYAVADQTYPLERTHGVISISQPNLIVNDGKGESIVELAAQLDILVLNTHYIHLDNIPSESLEDISQPSDLAYIVFTSGSTGRSLFIGSSFTYFSLGQPKGVEIEHHNLSHLVASVHVSGYFPITSGSRVLQFAPFSFDAAVFEWSLCLALGGTLCFAQSPYAMVGDYLADVIDSNKITHMVLTPSVLATLPTNRALPSLSQIFIGGEMAPDSLIEIWRVRANIWNVYGPSEWCVFVPALLIIS